MLMQSTQTIFKKDWQTRYMTSDFETRDAALNGEGGGPDSSPFRQRMIAAGYDDLAFLQQLSETELEDIARNDLHLSEQDCLHFVQLFC